MVILPIQRFKLSKNTLLNYKVLPKGGYIPFNSPGKGLVCWHITLYFHRKLSIFANEKIEKITQTDWCVI